MDYVNKIICGDALTVSKSIPDGLVDMSMTSPPYWGLRDYQAEPVIWDGQDDCDHQWTNVQSGLVHENRNNLEGTQEEVVSGSGTAYIKKYDDKTPAFCSRCNAWRGQLGLEPTFDLFIKHMLQITAELKRGMKASGSFYLNMGDTYGGTQGNAGDSGQEDNPKRRRALEWASNKKAPARGITPKCLVGVPWRLALRMIDEQGWILRNANIWHKPNPMPSSVKDRLSSTYEFVFHFVKSQRYYYDLDAIREPTNDPNDNARRIRQDFEKRNRKKHTWPLSRHHHGSSLRSDTKLYDRSQAYDPRGKNPGDLWDITTQPFPEAHFATFPIKLCEKPIKSSCPKKICQQCGKARERTTKPTKEYAKLLGRAWDDHQNDLTQGNTCRKGHTRTTAEYETTGWTDCGCKAGWNPGIVLDPFAGAGTTCVVAKTLGRRYIGIELNPKYVVLAEKRLSMTAEQKELFE